jgi:hypothetical protein
VAVLICIIPGNANAEVLDLSGPMSIKVTEMTVVEHLESLIQKTSLDNDPAVGYFVIDKRGYGESRGRINDAPTLPFGNSSTLVKRRLHFWTDCAHGVVSIGRQERFNPVYEPQSRFAPSILVLNRNLYGLADSWLRRKTGVFWTNPCALSLDQCPFGNFGLSDCCIASTTSFLETSIKKKQTDQRGTGSDGSYNIEARRYS